MRVMAEDARQVETVIDGKLYRARQGFFDIDNPQHAAAHLRSANLPNPSLSGVTSRAYGWRCGACGFGALFRICGRCGAECTREG